MENSLIITQDNFNYLVRQELTEYSVTLCYAIPRKTSKDYLGMKHKHIKHRIKDKKEALLLFENWKEDYVPKYYNKEIIRLFITYSPVIRYYVTCPKCQQNAEILNWMLMFGTDIEECHYIVCKHCANGMMPFENVVGECQVILFNKEEAKKINLQFENANVKWEEWADVDKKY